MTSGASRATRLLVVLPRELGQLPPASDVVGDKAYQLAKLLVLKARVPRFGVLTTSASRAHLARRELARELWTARQTPLDEEATRIALSETLVRAVANAPLPEEVESAVEELVASFTDDDLLAVRPSPVGEGPELRVLAGHLQTFLCVRGREAVSSAVRQCIASAFSPAALFARHQSGFAPLATEMGVIVQRVVLSEASGSCVSVAPGTSTQERKEVLVRVAWGLGAGATQELQRAGRHDQFRVPRPDAPDDGLLEQATVTVEIADKVAALRLRASEGADTELVPVEPADRERPALTENQARAVAAEALRLEAAVGRPVAFTFAFAGRLMHLLEARPVRAPRVPLDGGRVRTWDERLVPEGLTGPTTTLTASLFVRVASRAARRTLAMLGVPAGNVDDLEQTCEHLYGRIDECLYGDVAAFERVLSFVPTSEWVAPALARATAVPELARATSRSGRPMGLFALRHLGRLRRLARRARAKYAPLMDAASERAAHLQRASRTPLDAARLLDHLDEAEALLTELGASFAFAGVIAATFVDAARRVLEEGAPVGGPDEAQAVLLELLSGGSQPAKHSLEAHLEELTQSIAERPEVRAVFLDEVRPEPLFDRLADMPEAALAVSHLKDALHRFGARGVGSLKIESLPLRERPSLLLALLRGSLRAPPPSLFLLTQGTAGARKKAELRLQQNELQQGEMARTRVALLFSRRRVIARAVSDVARALEDAESLRLLLESGLDAARGILYALGERLFEHDVVDQPADVLSLSLEEIRGAVRGASIDASLRSLVAARRPGARVANALGPSVSASAVEAAHSPPERIETAGLMRGPLVAAGSPNAQPPSMLQGFAISPGTRTGTAFLLARPKSLKEDAPNLAPPESVVVLARLDPLLIPFLLGARAVVVERLLPLSVAASRLRALGIPAVGGVLGAMELIRRGERLIVDGHAGKVTLADRAPTALVPDLSLTDADPFARRAGPSSSPKQEARQAADADAPSGEDR